MLSVLLTAGDGAREVPAVLGVPVRAPEGTLCPDLLDPAVLDPGALAEAEAYLADREHTGRAGQVEALPRPLRSPARLLLVGVGEGAEEDWRAAGAAVVRASRHDESVTIALTPDADPEAVRGVAEGALLAAYRYRLAEDTEDPPRRLREVLLLVSDVAPYRDALAQAQAVAEATMLARDLVNTPSDTKSPGWFADQVAERVAAAATDRPGLAVAVRDPTALALDGFGGILAVGNGSTHGPRLLELSWRPEDSGDRPHVILVGKGITFDTGGIVIKPRDAMKLMRKDMAGAAAVVGATLGSAALQLPVRVTAVVPLAENMLSGSAYRPGDVVRHYGGLTSEVFNTDAEGRMVLADAIAYAVARLEPDVIVDYATLTGAATVALGKRTAALFTPNDQLASALRAAGAAAGERLWRMPLAEEYADALDSDVADVNNAPDIGAGAITAALYLRAFLGTALDNWAHVDMSAPAWADSAEGELVKGATGYGVRTLLRWLASL